MTTDVLSTALINSMARNLSVTDLIRTAEMLKTSQQLASIETLYSTWIQHNQEHPLLSAVLFNYSVILSDAGKLAPAREALERAVSVNPEFMPAYINLGRIYERLGSPALAVVQWAGALAKMAAVNGASVNYKTTALNQSARALESANQDDAAEEMLRQSLEIDSQQTEAIQHLIALRQRQCKWPVILPSDRVTACQLTQGLSPLSAAALTDDPVFQLAIASHYNETDVGTPEEAFEQWPAAVADTARLRVGYLSSDLREHAVGYLMSDVFGLHDRSQVEVYAYYCGPEVNDKLHDQYKRSVDHFIPVSHLDDAAIARKVATDGIHILVDLNGYTREARLKVVALRPAPIIVNWLGFPGTMGSPYHNYIIADETIIPESHELYFSERVLRLPCYQPSCRVREVAAAPLSRHDVGLPEKGFVYCCFNGTHKITRFNFERWLMILGRVPDSVLWLMGGTEATNERLRDYAAQHGVARERLVFADKVVNKVHLARYALADLFLDTTPYGAHTTASDALWMGLPVLTLAGRTFASRVCASLVRAAGVGELVCASAQEYVERAVLFGNNRLSIRPLSERLRSNRDTCTLFDTESLVRRLEQLYGRMWHEFKSGSLPRPNLSNLNVCLEIGVRTNHDEVEMQTIEDYSGWWLERLAKRYKVRPFEFDQRLALIGAERVRAEQSIPMSAPQA
jgi:predicted O-linked N-acetylglucosamine transferase (SPINDLY family)